MTIQGVATNSAVTTADGTSGTTSQNPMGDLDTTFLNLLVTELQSQDPTAPMDATQMVGQMVSLNQLDQLIGIHQILQNNATTATANSMPATAKGAN
jgi:flagellar basal-body rod modification protein FlgD